jgi:hypothetical protein
MFKQIIRMAAGVLVAAVIAFAIAIAPAAKAQSAGPAPSQGFTSQGFTKADRLPVPIKGIGCSQHAWPNIDPKCQYDLRKPAGDVRAVRIIALH